MVTTRLHIFRERMEQTKVRRTSSLLWNTVVITFFWECFVYGETEELKITDSIITSAKYIKILGDCLQSSAQKLELWLDWMLQQDNDPKHLAQVTRTWFEGINIKVMKSGRRTLDMNLIENLRKTTKRPQWNEVFCQRRVGKQSYQNMSDTCGELHKQVASFDW